MNRTIIKSFSVFSKVSLAVAAITLSFIFLSTPVSGQRATMTWSSEFCNYSGVYNPRNYTEGRLRNTIRLLNSSDFRLNVEATAWSFDEIDSLDVKKLDERYSEVKTELEALDIVPREPWLSIRKTKLKELKQVYELSRTTILAYRKPAILNDLEWAPSCKKKFAPALIAGGDDLLKVWTEVNVDSRTRNVDPDRLKRVFDQQYASPRKFDYALVETMTFGWWNCANGYIEYDGQDVDENQKREDALKKLFISIKEIECDQP